jgi:hypothetical protein
MRRFISVVSAMILLIVCEVAVADQSAQGTRSLGKRTKILMEGAITITVELLQVRGIIESLTASAGATDQHQTGGIYIKIGGSEIRFDPSGSFGQSVLEVVRIAMEANEEVIVVCEKSPDTPWSDLTEISIAHGM